MHRQFDDLMLGSVELFCLAGELGGFTAAATAAGVTPAAVSRAVARLEARLGIRLFVRSTRQIRLTDAGRVYMEQCRQALAQFADAERMATGEETRLSGRLRISVPTTYGHYRLLPLLPAFHREHPDVRLDLHISNRNIGFADEAFDLAIRVRPQADSTMIVRHLEDAPLVVVASPAYLKERRAPKTLADLAGHECIQFDLPSSGRRIPWLFRENGQDVEYEAESAYTVAEDVLGGVTLARAGAGLFQAYRFVVQKDLADGTLVEVLPKLGGRSRPYNLLYPHSRFVPPRVRAFIDFLTTEVATASS
ncbi:MULTISPECIES: LysR family transcriptional regulator [unclassified Luteibacter]|uniref:LysR family transcriptional regulator n=1 Tax=unclassified Luteibacter TaxID=2620188 RepID=UPI0008D78C6F|nr:MULTISPECIES: LysR family transcriptional regulator [unclassified Luteibacter]SEO57198.1 DNA-binding transcriptional regulator, LysR family [Luteibacter sp. UNC138MFCol5.1]SEV87780.1 DNA-binding transcriptional regulator, LysR family [Luteibacter sp. 329MFSha]